MKKIPTLFERITEGPEKGLLSTKVNPECQWVLDGEGEATKKFDGTAVLVQENKIFKRYELKPPRPAPQGFMPAQEPDVITGDQPGWVPADLGAPENKWLAEAVRNLGNTKGALKDGTYELCGPNVQGNPEAYPIHILMPHGAFMVHGCPRDCDGLKRFLAAVNIEGIVWHHPDGRRSKIKKRDFGLTRKMRPHPEVHGASRDMRVRLLWFSPAFFEELFKAGTFQVSKGLPADAKIIASGYDPRTAQLWFHVESATYDPVPEGGVLRAIEPLTFEVKTVASGLSA